MRGIKYTSQIYERQDLKHEKIKGEVFTELKPHLKKLPEDVKGTQALLKVLQNQ